MPNVLFRVLLFVSSYFPAFLIIAILFRRRDWRVAAGSLTVGLLGLMALALYVWVSKRRIEPVVVDLASCRPNDGETITYVLSYIVPFLTGVLRGPDSAIAFAVLFAVIGILYANSEMIYINPMLNLAGFHIYRIEKHGDAPLVLVTRKSVTRGARLPAVEAGTGIFFA